MTIFEQVPANVYQPAINRFHRLLASGAGIAFVLYQLASTH